MSEALRILHVSPSFYPAWAYGGVPRCAYELCRELVPLGHDVTVWTSDVFDRDSRLSGTETVVDGIRVRRFRNLSNRLAHDFQLYLPARIFAAARESVRDFDLVHIHSHRHLLQLAVANAARSAGVPYVLTGNGTVPAIERYVGIKHVLDALGVASIVRDAAACVAVSRAEVPHYTDVGVPPERVRVIPNGVRLAEFEPLPETGSFRRKHGIGEGPLVAFVGKITPRKGVDVLVRAMHLLPDSVQLVVAGNFMMAEKPIRTLVEELGLGDRIRFPGLLLGEERNALYVDADVVAYPSIDEIFGLVAAEAIMCGSPVVVCGDSGCGELVEASGGGAVVPYGDPAALAHALSGLLSDPDRRARHVREAQSYVRDNLGWDAIASRTNELYAEVLARA
jgi:glycosyltransferase involved in cell wall biosynthesis